MVESEKAEGQIMPVPLVGSRPALLRGFEAFYRKYYKSLLRYVMYGGATLHEAEDAVMETMSEILRRWEEIAYPPAYARKAVIHNFIKSKTRNEDRNLSCVDGESSEVGLDSAVFDPALNKWEDRQWVDHLLESLTPAQRDVMKLFIEDFAPAEIAKLLGKKPDAIRQNLKLARMRLRQHEEIVHRHVNHVSNPPPGEIR